MIGNLAAGTIATTILTTAPGGPTAQEKPGGTLVVANYGGANAERQKKAFYDPFAAETGIRVVMDQAGGQQVAKLHAQAAAGRVEWSLMTPFDQDAFFLWEKGLLQPLPEDIRAQAMKAYGANGPRVVSEFGIWRGVSASVFVCNPAVAAKCPKNAAEVWNVAELSFQLKANSEPGTATPAGVASSFIAVPVVSKRSVSTARAVPTSTPSTNRCSTPSTVRVAITS